MSEPQGLIEQAVEAIYREIVTPGDDSMRDAIRRGLEQALIPPEAARWQPMDTAPLDEEVLVYDRGWCGGKPRITVSRCTKFISVTPMRGKVSWEWSGVTDPDGWMPLPSPPAVTDEGTTPPRSSRYEAQTNTRT